MDDFNRDLSNDRVIELDNNKLHIRKSDPYGFWHISFERGQIPESLKGAFTSPSEAQRAIDVYLREKNREVKSTSK